MKTFTLFTLVLITVCASLNAQKTTKFIEDNGKLQDLITVGNSHLVILNSAPNGKVVGTITDDTVFTSIEDDFVDIGNVSASGDTCLLRGHKVSAKPRNHQPYVYVASTNTLSNYKTFNEAPSGTNERWIGPAIKYNGKWYFRAQPGETQWALYETDLTDAGTNRVWECDTMTSADGNVHRQTLYKGKLYLPGNNCAGIWDIYEIDGDISSKTNISNLQIEGNEFKKIIATSTHLFYVVKNDGLKVYSYDGSVNKLLLDTLQGSDNNKHAVIDDKLFFQIKDGAGNIELMMSDGNTVKHINLNTAGSDAIGFVKSTGTKVYFTATNGTNGKELYVTDDDTPTLVKDINISGNSDPKDPHIMNKDYLFFKANP
ncbi:MAG: hypothetical protein MI922_16865, partial [Bacteroidales bacterium]|nr:hypothetical protein [Bacteroidales bacterium]